MQKSYEKRSRDRSSGKSANLREPGPRAEPSDTSRFGGATNPLKDGSSTSARNHWNKLWVPPNANEWAKGGKQHFNQYAGGHSQWGDFPQFHERRNPENHFNAHGSHPMGESLVNNPIPWATPNLFPPAPNQLEHLELQAYYQFKLKKLQKQKKQSPEDIRQLNQLASLLKESLVLQDLTMKQQELAGFPVPDSLYEANPPRVNEFMCNGTMFYDQNLDLLQGQQVGWRPSGRHSPKEIWGSPSVPLSIPNRVQFSRIPEPQEFGRKSPGSGSPKAVSDFPGFNVLAQDFVQVRSKSNVNTLLLPSQDELDLHLAMVQHS